MKTFQYAMIGIFIGLTVIAVIVFATSSSRGGGDRVSSGPVLIWGVFPERSMRDILREFEDANEDYELIYVQKSESVFEQSLVEALARDEGPDMILFPHDIFLSQKDKIAVTGYELISENTFNNSFIDAGKIFLDRSGIYALPFAVDPIVMYWNKDIFAREGLASPPKNWSEFIPLAERFTQIDQTGGFAQSLIPFGASSNVMYQKDILSALIMQTGDEIVRPNDTGSLEVVLGNNDGAASALLFYTEFSDIDKSIYTWNSAEPSSRDAFASGQAALYIGRASDYPVISQLNPNLNFDVETLPQIKGSSNVSTFGKVYGLAVLKSALERDAAFAVLDILAFGPSPQSVPEELGLAPTKRDVLAVKPGDDFFPVVFDSALITEVWHDPDRNETRRIFTEMVDLTSVDRQTPEQAVNRASSLMGSLFR